MALNFRKLWNGLKIKPKTSSTADSKGDLEVIDGSGKLQYHNGSSVSPVVTADHSETLQNKSIDADNNTITNIKNDEIAADADIARDKLATATADYVLINSGTGEVSEEQYLAKVRGGTGADNSSVTFPASGEIVTTDATQTLTGKTIDGDDNTVQDLSLGSIKTEVGDADKFIQRNSSGEVVSGKAVPTGDVVGTSDSQTLSGKTFTDSIKIEDPGVGTNKVTIQSPTLAGDYTLTLPEDDGDSGQVLSTDGSGTLSWEDALIDPTTSAGDIIIRDGTNIMTRLPVGSNGQVLKVVSGIPAWGTDGIGGAFLSGRDISSSDDIEISDNGYILWVDSSGGAVTLTLPEASTLSTNFIVVIKDIAGSALSNNINIELSEATDSIDGLANGKFVLDKDYMAVTIVKKSATEYGTLVYQQSEVVPGVAARGVINGGYTGSNSLQIQYVEIPTNSNSTNFGNLLYAKFATASAGSETRGLVIGGYDGSTNQSSPTDYYEILTAANSANFGSLVVATRGLTAVSDKTRAVSAGGYTSNYTNGIRYAQFATLADFNTFGNLTVSRADLNGVNNSVRGIITGGSNGSALNTIDYFVTQTTANAVDFGDLYTATYSGGTASSSIIGLFAGGSSGSGGVTRIQSIILNTTGNASEWSTLTVAKYQLAGCGSLTKAVWCGGNTGSLTDKIETNFFNTAATSTSFGDLLAPMNNMSALSNNHGGLA